MFVSKKRLCSRRNLTILLGGVASLIIPILIAPIFLSAILLAAEQALAGESSVPVGVLLPLSGPYAAVGKDCQLGIEMAVQAKPSLRAVQFKYEDVQAEPKLAVAGFGKLVDTEKVQALIAVRGPVGMAVNPLASERKILLLGAVGHSEFATANPYAVQFWTTGAEEGLQLARFITEKGAKRIALFTAEDDWLESVSKAFRAAVASDATAKMVFDQSFSGAETDLQSLVSKALAAKPDAVVINVSISQLGVLSRRLREQGFAGQLWGNFWFPKPQVLEAAGAAAEGVSFVEMRTSFPKFLESALQFGKNEHPSAMVYSCYSAASYLAELVESGATSRELLTAGAVKMSRIALADGVLEIKDRRAKFSIVAKSIQQGKVVEVR